MSLVFHILTSWVRERFVDFTLHLGFDHKKYSGNETQDLSKLLFIFYCPNVHFRSIFQAGEYGMPSRHFNLRSLSVGNGGIIQSNAVLSTKIPALKLQIEKSVKVLPGGKIIANWIDISSQSLSIDGSGEISSAGRGFLAGPGVGTGTLCLFQPINLSCFNV